MRNNVDPIQEAAYQSMGINQNSPNPAVDPIQQAAYNSLGINNPQPQQSLLERLATDVLPYANKSAQAAQVPLVGIGKLGQALFNLPHNLISQKIPYSSTNISQDIGNITGVQIPQTPGFNTANNIASGVAGAFMPGGILGQAVSGAALSPNSPILGGAIGGAAASLGPLASGLKYLGTDPLAKLGMQTAAKNAALQADTENTANSILNNQISRRLQNTADYQKGYSAVKLAGDHPIPGLEMSNISGDPEVRQQTSQAINNMFGNTPAGQFYSQNPELFASNYSDIPEMSGITGSSKNPIDNLIAPGFTQKMLDNFSPGTNFGSSENPLRPLETYSSFLQSPTVANADELHRVFNMAKNSNFIKPSQAQLLNTAASNIKSNMIIPGLKDYDQQYGTNLAKNYISGDAPYKQEMGYQSISPQFDAATSGNWLPQQKTAQNISNMLGNGIKNNKILPGSPEYNDAQQLMSTMQKNQSQQDLNTQLLQSKITGIKSRPGAINYGLNALRTIPYLAGVTTKALSSPFGIPAGRMAGLIGAQLSNQQ